MWCWIVVALALALGDCFGQDLAPRAYIISPIHSNAVTLAYTSLSGDILFDGAVPITDSTGKTNIATVSYTHSLNFFSRSANCSVSLPYGVGTFKGAALGSERLAYRSGLLDSTFRFSVNLKGGRAMNAREFVKWRQKSVLGASLKIVAPTGQYDPTKLINYGTNRWAFKPELGYSHRWKNWIVDTYGGVWFFTENNYFFNGTNTQSESPIGSLEAHLSYDFKPRLWVSVDGNFWFGGSTSINGVLNPVTRQTNSRAGVTTSVPLTKHQSVKLSYSDGTYVRFGGH